MYSLYTVINKFNPKNKMGEDHVVSACFEHRALGASLQPLLMKTQRMGKMEEGPSGVTTGRREEGREGRKERWGGCVGLHTSESSLN